MSEVESNVVDSGALSAREEAAKTNALIAYGLMVLGLFTGIFWIVGAIWAMVKKGDAQGTRFEDHYSNITKVFWLGLILSIIGVILAFVVIGYFVLLFVWIWSVFKIVKGLANLTSNKAYAG